MDVHRLIRRDLVEAVAELRERDVDGALDVPGLPLALLAGVDDERALLGELAHGGDRDLLELAVQQVQAHQRGMDDDVLGCRVRGGVAQLEVAEVLEGAVHHQQGRDDVHALVRRALAHGLCAEDPPGGLLEQELEEQRLRVRHEAHRVLGDHVHDVPVQRRAAQLLLVQAGGCGRVVEDLHDEGADHSAVAVGAAVHVVRGDARLALGRAGHGQPGGRAEQLVPHLDGVAHGVDRRIGGAVARVDLDAAGLADLEARLDGQLRLRAHADRHDHGLRGDGPPGLQRHAVPGDRGDGVAEDQVDDLDCALVLLGRILVPWQGRSR